MKIALLCFWIVLTRVGYYFLIQGNHDGLYYMQMSNLKDISQYLGIAGLLLVSYNKQFSAKIRYAIIFTIIYCLSFSCIMLYPFLGTDLKRSNESVLLIFNMFWACASIILFLYVIFEPEKFSIKES
jgi:hypothetical protein